MILLDITYEGKDEVTTTLWGRGETFEDTKFLPYMYVIPEKTEKPNMIINGRKIVKIEELVMKDLNKEVNVWKIYFKNPSDLNLFRHELKEFGERREMDLPFARRYMIDKKLIPLGDVILPEIKAGKKEYPPRVLAFDIETIASKGIAIGKDPIIMASLWSENLKMVIGWGKGEGKHFIRVKDEKELIEKFVEVVDKFKPDIIVGYNSDSFDWPYFKERAKLHKVKFRINSHKVSALRRGRENVIKLKGLINIDLYLFIKNILAPYMKSETLKLDDVSKELVGQGKVSIGGAEGINDAWENNPKLLYEYSLQDAKVTYLLAMEVLPMIYTLASTVGQTLFDVSRMTSGQMVEWTLIKEAHKQKMLVPNRPKYEDSFGRRSVRFEGAFVKDPIKGLHSPIAVCDFRSLYPTIIMAHNISADTINCNHPECKKNISSTGTHFCTRQTGFIPETLKKLFDRRMKLKKKARELKKGTLEQKIVDTEQKGLKLILNSFYGYLGYANARWYTLDSARAVTAWGREYITQIMKEASMKNFTVVYGDTDSVMLTSQSESFKDDVINFTKEINKSLPSPIELEVEGFFIRGVFVTKKRYALLSEDNQLVVKGLEKVRRDWSKLARNTQGKVLRLILNNKVEDAKEYIREVIKKLKSKEIPISELIMKTQLTKPLNEYKQMAPHVKVAKDMKNRGEDIFPGMLIEYIVTPGGRSISERSIAVNLAKDYDSSYYIQNQVLPSVMRIFEALGGTKAELEETQKGLTSFF